MTIAAFFLGQVHGIVCGPQQRVGLLTILRIEADTDTDRNLHSVPFEGERPRNGIQNLQGNRVCVPNLAPRFQHDHELVAADTGHGVAVAHAVRESLGNGTKE